MSDGTGLTEALLGLDGFRVLELERLGGIATVATDLAESSGRSVAARHPPRRTTAVAGPFHGATAEPARRSQRRSHRREGCRFTAKGATKTTAEHGPTPRGCVNPC